MLLSVLILVNAALGEKFVQITSRISIHISKQWFPMKCKFLLLDEKIEAILAYLHMHSSLVVTANSSDSCVPSLYDLFLYIDLALFIHTSP